MKDEYVSKAKINKITATSRSSIKIREQYFTFEYSEERLIPDLPDVDTETERALLWEDCNAEVDRQIDEVVEASKN